MLVKVHYQNWDANFAYAPPLEDAVVNTDDVVSAAPCESRGEGPFTRVNLRDGTHMIVKGRPDQLLPSPLSPSPRPDKPGYYWARRMGGWVVAYYEGDTFEDGSDNRHPVTLDGSDGLFAVEEFDAPWIHLPEPALPEAG